MQGNASAFYEMLGKRESGGRYDMVNSLGYLGKYQMGEAALIDAGFYVKDGTAKNDWKGEWTGKDGVTSREGFLASPEAQEKAIRAYHRRVWGYIRNMGLDGYSGSTVQGIPITDSGMLAGAHLLGVGGLKQFLESKGMEDPADGYGTRISEYIRKFAGYDIGEIAGETVESSSDGSSANSPDTQGGAEASEAEAGTQRDGSFVSSLADGVTSVIAALSKPSPASEQRQGGGGNVVINGRTAVHADSGGTVSSPDVCKTPGKCRPRAYRNVAKSADAAQTAGTVFINGQPACHKDSIFATSSGDEGGSCGGIRSGTIKGKAEFITASPNVMIEGIPAVRQGDLMVSNNRNTPPMPLMQPGAGTPPALDSEGAEGVDEGAAHAVKVDVLGEHVHGSQFLILATEED